MAKFFISTGNNANSNANSGADEHAEFVALQELHNQWAAATPVLKANVLFLNKPVEAVLPTERIETELNGKKVKILRVALEQGDEAKVLVLNPSGTGATVAGKNAKNIESAFKEMFAQGYEYLAVGEHIRSFDRSLAHAINVRTTRTGREAHYERWSWVAGAFSPARIQFNAQSDPDQKSKYFNWLHKHEALDLLIDAFQKDQILRVGLPDQYAIDGIHQWLSAVLDKTVAQAEEVWTEIAVNAKAQRNLRQSGSTSGATEQSNGKVATSILVDSVDVMALDHPVTLYAIGKFSNYEHEFTFDPKDPAKVELLKTNIAKMSIHLTRQQ